MELSEWHKLTSQVYDWDGGWRDIFTLSPDKEDWGKWIDFINLNYDGIEFYNGTTSQVEPFINKSIVFDFLDKKTEFGSSATFKIAHIIANCRYFFSDKIEIDIDPRQIKTIEDHTLLMNYMTECSKILDEKVFLSYEMDVTMIYIVASKGEVVLCLE